MFLINPIVKIKYYLRKILFFGSRYQCPMCGSKVKTLRPFGLNFPVLTEKKVIGGGYRPHAQYPVCRSLDREISLFILIKKDQFFPTKFKSFTYCTRRKIKSHYQKTF